MFRSSRDEVVQAVSALLQHPSPDDDVALDELAGPDDPDLLGLRAYATKDGREPDPIESLRIWSGGLALQAS